MHEDKDEDRIEAARQLAERDPRAAAVGFRVIACDHRVDGGLRMQDSSPVDDAGPPLHRG